MAQVITISPEQWASYMKQLSTNFMPAMVKGIRAGALRCLPVLQEAVVLAPPASPRGTVGAFDTGQYRMAWRTVAINLGATIYNLRPYSGVIEYGRRAAAVSRAGVTNLAGWAHRKLGLNREDAKRAAWAIATSLRSRRLQARKVMRSALPDMIKAVHAEVTKTLDTVLRTGKL